MHRTCLGDLARLVDDTILKALCLCDILDLLRVEQTCRYLKFLASHPEVWYALALRLPREAFPCILPGQRREDTDLRTAILQAFRGHTNWTSDSPKPCWSRSIAIKPSHCQRMLADPQFLPGGRFFYFTDETFYCFDIVQDRYILERKNPFVELLASGFEYHPGSNTLTICLIGRSVLNSEMAVKIELSEVDLQSGKIELIQEIVKPWSDLCAGAGGTYVMLSLPVVSGHRVTVPYLCVDSESFGMTNGGIIIDFARNLVLFLSFRNFPDGKSDRRSSVTTAGSHLLFVTGLGSSRTAVCAVSLTRFEDCWQPIDDPSTWGHYDVLPGHIDAEIGLLPSIQISPTNERLSVHTSTWLDLERARRQHPSVDSVWLIDVAFVHREEEDELPVTRASLQVYFAELETEHKQFLSSPESASRTKGLFITADQDSIHAHIGHSKRHPFPLSAPIRTGRTVAEFNEEGVTQVMAAQVGIPEWKRLRHLTGKYVRHYILDYYTGVALRSSQIRDGESFVEGSAEMVVEGYD